MTSSQSNAPRILLVTTEIASLPDGMTSNAHRIRVGTGRLAEKSAALVKSLYHQGIDIHVALPNYRRIFNGRCSSRTARPPASDANPMLDTRVHLAQDRHFFYQNVDVSECVAMDGLLSLVFQREVINLIIPSVQPDLIHCMDWMTGLIPAMSRKRHIPCLFSIHNFETDKTSLSTIEDVGIDTADFWHHLYFDAYPRTYESARDTLPVDFLASGLFASRYIWIDRPDLMQEIIKGHFNSISENLKLDLINKWEAGCFVAFQNATVAQYQRLYEQMLDGPLRYQ